ncbi:uncharacterized protein LOC142987171 [Anticarsia gemmatalis]|uniref:uncharacterized protein LOC142987171 n=1 Tax=Anticarsia gemmatalis TaxID=129554 RepID=UPI003F7629D6
MDSKSIINSNTSTSSDLSKSKTPSTKIKAASAPIVPSSSVGEVKQQTSAPCYFHSLKENDAPPFQKPGVEPKPKLIIGSIFNEQTVVEMIAAADADKEYGLKKYLAEILVEQKITRNHDLSEKNFLISLLRETIDYAAQRDFDAFKLSVLLTIYLDSHCYFKWYYWQSPIAVWNYFKEIMIRHTIEDRDIVSADRIGGRRIDATSAAGEMEIRPRTVIVRLARRSLRDDLINGARVRRGATTADLNMAGAPRRFYVNERLTKLNRLLFRRARDAGQRAGWKYVWTRHGRILARRGPGDKDSPTGQEVFEPEECYDIITHFHTVYLSNLPLIHILTFGAYRLKLLWPYKPKA